MVKERHLFVCCFSASNYNVCDVTPPFLSFEVARQIRRLQHCREKTHSSAQSSDLLEVFSNSFPYTSGKAIKKVGRLDFIWRRVIERVETFLFYYLTWSVSRYICFFLMDWHTIVNLTYILYALCKYICYSERTTFMIYSEPVTKLSSFLLIFYLDCIHEQFIQLCVFFAVICRKKILRKFILRQWPGSTENGF